MNDIQHIFTERVDDIPMLLEQMQRMELPTLIDQHFPAHGNWKGLSLGWASTIWLSSILSQGDHRLTHVEPPLRRIWILKRGTSAKRPLGIPATDDKLLQRAVGMLLEPIYEQDFLACSYGFRPKRSAHGALSDLWNQCARGGVQWILDMDISKFFDTLEPSHLRSFLQHRVRDGVITRLIGKWLNAGVLEEGVLHYPEAGTPQGGSSARRSASW